MKTKLGILGCGNMGSAIALGLAKKSKHFSFFTYTPTFKRAARLAKQVRGKAVKKIGDLKGCEYFLIACKPQQFDDLAPELKKIVGKNSKIISVMSGISTKRLQKTLGTKKVVRAMPNTPAFIGEGVTTLYTVSLSKGEKAKVQKIFAALGEVHPVSSDHAIDITTGIIASGPAYLFEIARILTKKLVARGIASSKAEAMVKQLFKGASLLMMQSRESIETLRNRVTSKKGTTAAALAIFKKHKLEKTIHAALDAAHKRAKELSK